MQAACWTCRNRTIQCDKTSFPCAKCKKAGLECFERRPLRWVKGIAIRGKMRGRMLEQDSKASDEISSAHLPRKQVLHPLSKVLAINITPQFALQDPSIKALDWSSRFYLDYCGFPARLVRLLYILYDSESNPFRHLLTYAMNDSTLRYSIIALAARHFANTGRSFDQVDDTPSPRFANANLDALYFKKQAIKALSSSLTHPEPSRKDMIMATILLLIFLDLLESGIEGWQCHLHGVEGLVNLSHTMLESNPSERISRQPGETVQETRRFIARQFLLSISTIGGAFSDPKSRSELSVHFDDSKHQESIVRSFLGCPEFLLRAIRYFSNQRHMIETLDMQNEPSIHEHVRDTLTMLELTTNFDCLEWASAAMNSRTSSTTDIQRLSMLSEAYKTAAAIYGKRIIRSFGIFTGTTTPDNEGLVLRLLEVIHSLKSDAALFKCLLWPTFIAGLECQGSNEQRLIIESLRMLWDLTCCLNVINASKILRDHWERKNFDSNSTEQAKFHFPERQSA
ncbi:hypothetical protein N7457_001546 [Penicillium paradoxum]|uniref:uncharacterized protein n=1 Tax=Penicillium paradoxum TaxID=176176 RepID=UPI0025495095|nr:uncharacterized protein N7457_001546 [Penicillium paradoxum]KAJ5794947.1 hypothetical protein N7457_001546 [Penicillium paradoxum]